MEVDVQGAGQAEDIHKGNTQYKDEQTKAGRRAPVEYPVEEQHKANREKGRKDVGQEHGSVIVARLGEEILIAFVAALLHLKGFLKAEAAGFKHITFVATGALDIKDAVCFGAFAEHNYRSFESRELYEYKGGENVGFGK